MQHIGEALDEWIRCYGSIAMTVFPKLTLKQSVNGTQAGKLPACVPDRCARRFRRVFF